eukprot:CAMPEP_0173105002 /NCGR_PEP_ID=MMETSP1102-20130122/39735_1 /TAXON_ID=49646 /ORGANISM="Geminigera sp., Strain Caron Lab Isolate" /LENGTH=222 /DNA_ID=CAMNT_0014000943 /DNA_START=12 /DNA_END=677 /DNA_ORIENTATION=+
MVMGGYTGGPSAAGMQLNGSGLEGSMVGSYGGGVDQANYSGLPPVQPLLFGGPAAGGPYGNPGPQGGQGTYGQTLGHGPSTVAGSAGGGYIGGGEDAYRQQEHTILRLQEDLRNAHNEQRRLSEALREYEMSSTRSQDELRAYREAMERREEEYQRIRMTEERRLSEVVDEYRRRFEHERKRLAQALERNNQLTRTIAAIIPEFAAVEREMQVAGQGQRTLI